MHNTRKKRGWVFWTTAALIGLPVLYVASFGPACWLADWLDQDGPSEDRIVIAYYPILLLAEQCPEWVRNALMRYGDPQNNLGAAWYAVTFYKQVAAD